MRARTIVILAVIYVVLLILGGVTFHFLETDNEEETAETNRAAIVAILAARPCLSAQDVSDIIQWTIEAYDQGVLVTPNTTSETNWDMASSIFFSSTIATTIGYGNISPATRGGKVFAVFFAIFTIPVCLVMLAGIGGKLADFAKKLETKLSMIEWCSKHPKTGRALRLVVIFLMFYLFIMIIPAVIFWQIEDWAYLDALYYCFITLTTIGFGDFVAGTGEYENRALYRLCLSFWILIGLAFISTCISMAQELTESLVNKAEVSAEEKGKDNEQEEKDQKDNNKDAEKAKNKSPVNSMVELESAR